VLQRTVNMRVFSHYKHSFAHCLLNLFHIASHLLEALLQNVHLDLHGVYLCFQRIQLLLLQLLSLGTVEQARSDPFDDLRTDIATVVAFSRARVNFNWQK